MKYLIEGGRKLFGTIRISGSKNAVLPILAAGIVTGKKSIIHNCPDISDVRYTIEILKCLGCDVVFKDGTITVDSSGEIAETVPEALMKKLRSSIILLGAIMNRRSAAQIAPPGGCELGKRPIDIHIKVLREMGAVIDVDKDGGRITYSVDGLRGGEYTFSFPSVGATENIMIASLIADGAVTIKNPAKEPEIVDLQNFLNACGANITGAGTDAIIIEPQAGEYMDCEYTVLSDRIEAATYMAATVATGSTVKFENAPCNYLDSISAVFSAMGAHILKHSPSEMTVIAPKKLKPVGIITTKPHPGFPTDAQAILMASLLRAKGGSMIVENIFENRYNHIPELQKMGANIKIDGNAVTVYGVEKLYGTQVSAKDLRAGASLIIAALCADGETVISDTHHISRGYENIVGKLKGIGAQIKIIHNS
jgi:UDP-N-acetylglucosamine 1-carboxyvinyltransferase